ncbi:MAG TPA: hypothetical protein VGQ36_02785 [Thermoanaerobaculia bacterium]|jgi:hypothetical protein|nr:hypothetical protein [Thermoanaerobaculia bacterium]
MPVIDLGVLDTIISVVVVILLLSMVVQSLQTFVKKLLNFKSKQIEKSLEQLFDHVSASAPEQGAADAAKVLDHFRSLGRHTLFGRCAVQSISKADLSKVVTSIESASVVPKKVKDAAAAFFAALEDARKALDALSTIQLSADSVAKVAELRTKLAPVVAHVANLDPKLIVSDVLTLRDLQFADAQNIVAEVQTQIEQAVAANPGDKTLAEALSAVRELAQALANVQIRLARVVAPLRERVDAIESWYDTVMLGFQERYERHMRTWTFVISLAVTVLLNADVFRVYKRLATDSIARAGVQTEYTNIQQRYLKQIDDAKNANAPPETIQQLTRKLENALDDAAQSYPALGIQPLDWDDFNGWTVVGWIVMAFLLGLGAPFWQDALESLFGLKNYLRQKTDTKKVEQESGAGGIN